MSIHFSAIYAFTKGKNYVSGKLLEAGNEKAYPSLFV